MIAETLAGVVAPAGPSSPSLSNTKGCSSTYLAMGFVNVRAVTQKRRVPFCILAGRMPYSWTRDLHAAGALGNYTMAGTSKGYRYSTNATQYLYPFGPSGAKSASCSVRRALLMPQIKTGSLYRCGKRT